MRIAISATMLDARPSGLGMYTVKLIKALAAQATDQTTLIVFTAYPEAFEGCDVQVRKVLRWVQPRFGLFGKIVRFLWHQVVYPVRLLKEYPDVIYSATHHAVLWTRRPQVVTIHDLIPLKFPNQNRWMHRYFTSVLPRVLARCARIITVSDSARQDVLQYYRVPPERVIAIHESYEDDGQAHDERLTSSDGRPEAYFLVVGPSFPHKNVERVLEAYAAVRERTGRKLVVVGGRPDYLRALRAKARALALGDAVVFAGYVARDQLVELYAEATALVFASLYEGFGIPALEAMACGCSVIASNVSSLPEVCGDAAYYVDPQSVSSIADALCRLASDPALCARLRQRGIERVRQFSWERAARQTLDVLIDAAQGRVESEVCREVDAVTPSR